MKKTITTLIFTELASAFIFSGCYSTEYINVTVADTTLVPVKYAYGDSVDGYNKADQTLGKVNFVTFINSKYSAQSADAMKENLLLEKAYNSFINNKDIVRNFVVVDYKSVRTQFNEGKLITPENITALQKMNKKNITHVISLHLVDDSPGTIEADIINTSKRDIAHHFNYKQSVNTDIYKDIARLFAYREVPNYVVTDKSIPVEWDTKIKKRRERQLVTDEYIPWWAATTVGVLGVGFAALLASGAGN